MNAPSPTWLSIMENGSIGEARTKSFLIDRFWVLERSVDVDGADFLIELRGTGRRHTDGVQPRLGVVQAKFYKDERTTHHVPQEYVLDEQGQPINGFFALLHVGVEDAATMFLLSAKEIVDTLELGTGGSAGKYVLGARARGENFEVRSRSRALDRIEHSLKMQSPAQTLALMDELRIPYRALDRANIDYSWALPIPNQQVDIPREFVECKKKLLKLTSNMEDALRAIDEIVVCTDPKKALDLVDAFDKEYGNGVSFPFDWNDWQYLRDGMTEHERYLEGLHAEGLLDGFLALGKDVRERLERLAADLSGADDARFELVLSYDADTLILRELRVVPVDDASAAEPGGDGMVRLRGRLGLARARSLERLLYNMGIAAIRQIVERRYPDPYSGA
jgi:hypothetical protein